MLYTKFKNRTQCEGIVEDKDIQLSKPEKNQKQDTDCLKLDNLKDAILGWITSHSVTFNFSSFQSCYETRNTDSGSSWIMLLQRIVKQQEKTFFYIL